MKKHDVLSDNQYGFREGRSTEDAILKLTTYIYKLLDISKPSLCIFVDLSNAFDTVCHKRLLEKLEKVGMRGKPHYLLKSYLLNRKQVVDIDGVMSTPRTITYGVPQDTVLGPLLFTIYIDSLMKMTTVGNIISYDDDTAVIYSDNTWQQLKPKMEKDFNNIFK